MHQHAEHSNASGMLRKILFWLIISSATLLVFLMLFNTFESITLRAVQKSYTEFTQHTATISESIQSLVRALGTQIYYISSTTRLRTQSEMRTFDRIYAMRELGQYVSSSGMLQSIYVFNDVQQKVFSTDELFFSTDTNAFADKEAVRMHKDRGAAQRMRLEYRLIQAPGLLPKARASYALMVFEVNTQGNPTAGSIMLNLDPDWFSARLLDFPGDSYIVLDAQEHIIARQSPWLDNAAVHFLPLIREQSGTDGYVAANYEGLQYLCFYSMGPSNGWLHLRIMPLADQLPGLSAIRMAAFLVFGGIALSLLLALLVSFFRIYKPFSAMRERLQQNDHQPAADFPRATPIKQLDKLLAASQTQQVQAKFRDVLAGKPVATDLLPPLPGYLLLVETPSADLLPKDLGDAPSLFLAAPARGDVVLLLRAVQGAAPLAYAQEVAQACGCRCYLSAQIDCYDQLPQRLLMLRELQRLRLLYPGQRTFSETLLAQHRDPEVYPACEGAAIISGLRSGDMQAVRTAFFAFINRLRRTPYGFLRYALEHLLEQVEALTPEGATSSASAEDLLQAAGDPEDLLNRVWPLFQAACGALAEKRRRKFSATAQQAVLRLDMGYRDPSLSVQQIADEMGISAAYLRRQFLEMNQMSASEYLNRVRIKHAQALLQSTDLTVEAIASEVGFENTKYMFVLFKRIVGVTPRQYRLVEEAVATNP